MRLNYGLEILWSTTIASLRKKNSKEIRVKFFIFYIHSKYMTFDIDFATNFYFTMLYTIYYKSDVT